MPARNVTLEARFSKKTDKPIWALYSLDDYCGFYEYYYLPTFSLDDIPIKDFSSYGYDYVNSVVEEKSEYIAIIVYYYAKHVETE